MIKPLAVLISDIHYNIKNLECADQSVRMAHSKALDLGVPLIIAGDLHDTKALLRGECVAAMMKTLGVSPVRRIVIPGNHCTINERSSSHSLEFLRPLCEIVDEPRYDEPTGLWLIPYQHDSDNMRNILAKIPKGSTIIGHQGVKEAYMGEYVQDKSAVEKEVFEDFRTCLGHYHRRQDIKAGRPRRGAVGLISYIGSPYTTSFGEATDPEKGFRILMSDGTLDFVPTNLRRHIIHNTTTQAMALPEIKPGDLLWLKVTGPQSELAKIKKTHLSEKLGISDFKLDKIPSDNDKLEDTPSEVVRTVEELVDSIIDNMAETDSRKIALKHLWRDLV